MNDETVNPNGRHDPRSGASGVSKVGPGLAWAASTLGILAIAAGVLAYAGMFEVAADRPHWSVTVSLLDLVRSRSVAAGSRSLIAPELTGEARLLAGAGNYDAMCAQCHLRPGVAGTELSAVLYPAPPNFAEKAPGPDREAFWVIKHGIKMTGMGAWGKKIPDDDIWNLVAFVKTLPTLTPAEYESLVSRSEGHAHGGAERGAAPHGDLAPHPGLAHDRDGDRAKGAPDRATAHGHDKAGDHAHRQ